MNQKNIILMIVVLVFLWAILFLWRFLPESFDNGYWACVEGEWVAFDDPQEGPPDEVCEKTPETVTVNDFSSCLEAGFPIMESYPRQCRDSSGNLYAEDIGNASEKSDLIILETPRPGDQIESPLMLSGMARGNWYFEADFPVKIYDANGFLLGLAIAQAQDDWMTTEFVDFEAELSFSLPSTKKGYLILEKDNPSGLEENYDELMIPIVFDNSTDESDESMSVKIFLSDTSAVNDPNFDCSVTEEVERTVPRTLGVARASIEALLRGETPEERDSGYVTNINSGVRLNSILIENGIAKIDFNEKFSENLGGSCRVTAIRAQIEDTLKQFSSVSDVLISVNGETEGVLEP